MNTYRTTDGDMVDEICKSHYGTEDMTEAVYAANPGLAARGAILPKGIVIKLPQDTKPNVATPKRLWG